MQQSFMAHLFLVHLQQVLKKSPALTLSQARRIIAQVIRDEIGDGLDILECLHYQQTRNHRAYLSHCKRTLRRLHSRPKMSEVS